MTRKHLSFEGPTEGGRSPLKNHRTQQLVPAKLVQRVSQEMMEGRQAKPRCPTAASSIPAVDEAGAAFVPVAPLVVHFRPVSAGSGHRVRKQEDRSSEASHREGHRFAGSDHGDVPGPATVSPVLLPSV